MGGSRKEELKKYPPPSLLSYESWMFMKGKPNSKTKSKERIIYSQKLLMALLLPPNNYFRNIKLARNIQKKYAKEWY